MGSVENGGQKTTHQHIIVFTFTLLYPLIYLKHLGNMRSLFYAEPPCGSRRAEEGSQSAMHIIQDSVMIISPSTFMGDLLCLVLLRERKSFMTEWNDCGRGKREERGGESQQAKSTSIMVSLAHRENFEIRQLGKDFFKHSAVLFDIAWQIPCQVTQRD